MYGEGERVLLCLQSPCEAIWCTSGEGRLQGMRMAVGKKKGKGHTGRRVGHFQQPNHGVAIGVAEKFEGEVHGGGTPLLAGKSIGLNGPDDADGDRLAAIAEEPGVKSLRAPVGGQRETRKAVADLGSIGPTQEPLEFSATEL